MTTPGPACNQTNWRVARSDKLFGNAVRFDQRRCFGMSQLSSDLSTRPTPFTPETTDDVMSQQERVVSLDQFRGYCVLGMFVVNFLGGMASTHHLLRHNNTHFSLADSIMPAFILISGFSYRMTFVKRLLSQEPSSVRNRYFWRSIGLIFLSLMLFGFGNKISTYSELTWENLSRFVVLVVKADMWEVLAIIGACQILLLPFIAWSARRRMALFFGLGISHLLLSWWFNWDFVYGRPNALDQFFGTVGKRAWDGGLFGILAWSEIMLLGTLLPDLVNGISRKSAMIRLAMLGTILMVVGYSASCLSRLYDKPESVAEASQDLASDPVMPPWEKAQGRKLVELLAEPPLVPPPGIELRAPNYWAMDKRIVSQSFVYFSAGWAVVLYGLFVMICDIRNWTFAPLTTFGQNPLAAYIIHHAVEVSLLALFPKDSSAWWASVGMLLSIAITYKFVRFLEDRQLYLRL